MKIQQIGVALRGAAATNGGGAQLFEVEVIHPGHAKNRRHGKSSEVVEISAPPRHDKVEATLGPLAALAGNGGDRPRSRARGDAARSRPGRSRSPRDPRTSTSAG